MAITSFTLPYGTDSEGGPKYTSPLFQPYLFSVFCGSLVVLHGAYHLSANTVFAGQGDSQARKRSWVLTTIAGAVMSVASLPYLFDLFTHGFDMHAVHPRTAYLADPLAVFFIAYLLS